jgi:uncharacterized protein YgiM (DUF1202 family)
MNWKAVSIVLVLSALAWSRPGHAEKVTTNQIAKLYSRAGEQSPVILKLKSGQIMTVLAKDGRWIKVRVSGRTGWIPRSKLDMPNEDEDIARNTRRRPFVDGRGTKRGFGGESGPDDRIGADATGDGDEAPARSDRKAKPSKDDDDDKPAKARKAARGGDDEDDDKPAKAKPKAKPNKKDDGDGDDPGDAGAGADDAKEPARPMAHVAKATDIYNEPNSSSDASFTAQPRTALYIVEEKGKWTFVENDEGDAGYVLTSKLDVEDAAAGPRARTLGLRARLGLTQLSQSVSTPGGTAPVPDNYSAGSSTVTLALGGSAVYPYGKRYWLGGELAYDYDLTLFGGIENTNAGMKTTTGFTFHNLNLRALGGYDLQSKRGTIAFARLGLHYESFQIDNVSDFTKNTAKIPNQIIYGPTLGAALAIPRLTDSIGLQISLDLMPLAHVDQTKNLEDGTNPGARSLFLGGVFSYRWKPRIDFQGTLDVGYTSVSFDGAAPTTSMRGHTGTGTSSGSDLTVTASFGVVYSL